MCLRYSPACRLFGASGPALVHCIMAQLHADALGRASKLGPTLLFSRSVLECCVSVAMDSPWKRRLEESTSILLNRGEL